MKRFLGVVIAAALSTVAAPAIAQDAVDQAKMLFSAGAQAYAKGDFRGAVQAFEAAHRLAPRPAILFSMAQAHKRQYAIDGKPDDLRAAVTHYKAYVEQVPQGGRRGDAAAALAELRPMLERLSPEEATKPAPVAAVKAPPRVTVTSATMGATVSLDGGKPEELPLIAEVSPGKHKVKISAPGHFDAERDVVAVEGGVFPLDIPLKERPARVALVAPAGAQISVDGRPVGTAPLSAPLEVSSGKHLVAVTKDGYKPLTQDIDLGRGASASIRADLETTAQRKVSYVFLGVGAGAVAVGIVSTVVAYYHQNQAKLVQDEAAAGNIELSRVDEYEASRLERDNWRKVAIGGYVGGAALAATGFVLYLFDKPVIEAVPARRDDQPKTVTPSATPDMEMSAVPIFAPGFAGGSVIGRF